MAYMPRQKYVYRNIYLLTTYVARNIWRQTYEIRILCNQLLVVTLRLQHRRDIQNPMTS